MQSEPSAAAHQTLRDLFCEEYHCGPNEFEEKAFGMSLRPFTTFAVKLLWKANRRLFDPDLDILRQLGGVTSSRELRAELEMHRHNHPPAGLIRKQLKLRLSGQQLITVAAQLFSREESRRLRESKAAPRTAPAS